MPLIVGVYMPKGGVSKTNMAVSLAGAVAKRGKKVLLVDADSQCNLTKFCTDLMTADDRIVDRARIASKLRALQCIFDGTSDEQTRDDATAEMKRLLQELNKLEAQNEGQLRQGEVGEEGTERACSQPAAAVTATEGGTAGARKARKAVYPSINLPDRPLDDVPDMKEEYVYKAHEAFAHDLLAVKMERDTIYTVLDEFQDGGPNDFQIPELHTYNTDNDDIAGDAIQLLIGDHRFSNFVVPEESKSAKSSQSGVRSVLGLRHILMLLCKEHGFDIVILDMGPASSRSQHMLLLTLDLIIPVIKADLFGYEAVVMQATQVLPRIKSGLRVHLDSWLKAGEGKAGFRWAREAVQDLSLPKMMTTLAVMYTIKKKEISGIAANFIESADRFLLPRNGTESFVDDTVRSLYMHWNKRAVVAFMPHLRVFEVSQEMGIPVTLLTNASINTAMKDIGISRKVYTPDLQLVNERFGGLVDALDAVAVQLNKKPLKV